MQINQTMEKFQAQMDHMDVTSEAVMTQMDQNNDDQIAQVYFSSLLFHFNNRYFLPLSFFLLFHYLSLIPFSPSHPLPSTPSFLSRLM